MKLKDNIINLLKRLGQGQAVRKKSPPESLSVDAMAKVMQEVKYLRSKHAVDVRELEEGEVPTDPRPANK